MEQGKEPFRQADEQMKLLHRLFAEQHFLAEDVCYLGEYLQERSSLRFLMLVRCREDGTVRQSFCWQDGQTVPAPGGEGELEEFTAALHGVYGREGTVTEAEFRRLAAPYPEYCAQANPILETFEENGSLLAYLILAGSKGNDGWTQRERTLFSSVVSLLDISLRNRSLNSDNKLQGWVFEEIMDKMDVFLYITDVKTDRILFMNKTLREHFGVGDDYEDQICWKVMQKGMTGRCPFCPIPKLQAGGEENASCIWEEHNTLTGRTYENYDSLMRWVDGRVVHFQQSVDVTETRALTLAADLDELTGALNRRAGRERLEKTLKGGRWPISFCMIDLNGLKQVNDAYGHQAGDRYLSACVFEAFQTLEQGDYAVRLSGDEFLLVYHDIYEKQAEERLHAIQSALAESPQYRSLPFERSFCFGVETVREPNTREVRELLEAVDERMYTQKRRRHIEQSRKRMAASGGSTGSAPFQYDKERLYDALSASTEDYVYVSDVRTGTFRYPKAMVEEFGLPGEIVENAAAVWGEKIHPDDQQAFLESNQEILDGRSDSHTVEYRAKNRRGEWVWLRCRGRMERDGEGNPSLFAGMIQNLGKRSRIDPLTGVLNKFEFQDVLTGILETSPSHPLAVMVVDIDDFRHINDLYDRQFGDAVIRRTAQRLQTYLPAGASVYRLDGDEFGLIFRGGSREEVKRYYAGLRETFDRQQQYEGRKYYCSLSAGCVFYPEHRGSGMELIKYAMYSLEYAKSKGKGRLVLFSEDILLHKARALELTELLRESVENGMAGFRLFFQPQVRPGEERIDGCEALCRWSCDRYGAITPDEFIPLLEESGLILPVGRWVFEEAVKACARWNSAGESLMVNVNLSYLQLEDPSFYDFMRRTMERCGVPPRCLVVELTESYLAANIEVLADDFRKIRGMNVRIAMDDFGTGYSSLGILKQSPADIVKIDRTFVHGILNSSFDITFIRFIVELCHTVGIEVCLEGVETREEYEAAQSMGIDSIQGFYFGRPMPAEEFEALLEG